MNDHFMSGAWLWGPGGVAVSGGWFYIGWCAKGWVVRRQKDDDCGDSEI